MVILSVDIGLILSVDIGADIDIMLPPATSLASHNNAGFC